MGYSREGLFWVRLFGSEYDAGSVGPDVMLRPNARPSPLTGRSITSDPTEPTNLPISRSYGSLIKAILNPVIHYQEWLLSC